MSVRVLSSAGNLFARPVPRNMVVLTLIVLGHLFVSALCVNQSTELYVKGTPREPWPAHGDTVLAVTNAFLAPVAGVSSREHLFPAGRPTVGGLLVNSLMTGFALWLMGFVLLRAWRVWHPVRS